MEKRHCDACDQLLLADEFVCWNCGAAVGGEQTEPRGDAILPEAVEPSQALTWLRGSPAVIYTILSVIVVVFACSLTLLLGGQPRASAESLSPPEGWVAVVDEARTVSLFLPEQWQRWDPGAEADKEQVDAIFGQSEIYDRAADPLAAFADDLQVVLFATGAPATDFQDPGPFLLVVRSEALNRLDLQEAIGLADSSSNRLLSAIEVQEFQKNYVALLAAPESETDGSWRCQQQFTIGRNDAVIVALCYRLGAIDVDAVTTIEKSIQRIAP